jgi:hypothetical protein
MPSSITPENLFSVASHINFQKHEEVTSNERHNPKDFDSSFSFFKSFTDEI